MLAVIAAASPWPSILFYRTVMNAGGIAVDLSAAGYVPVGLETETDIAYGDAPEAKLDMYRPARASGQRLPVLVWVHGGAYVAGDKAQVASYLKVIAGHGFATIAVNYSLAPGARFPAPVREVAAALQYIRAHANDLAIDPQRIALGGDSAGAQIAAQAAIALNSPDYATRLGVERKDAFDLAGLVLFCGLYDPELKDNASAYAHFLSIASWAYFGTDDIAHDARRGDYSVVANLPQVFPPMFVSVGNADPLAPHSRRLAQVARAKGLAVHTLFFERPEPRLAHEYQFDLGSRPAQVALERTIAFLKGVFDLEQSTALNETGARAGALHR